MAELPLILPPTSQLPSIKQIASYPLKDLFNAVEYLKVIYNPEVRGSRRRRPTIAASDSEISFRLHARCLDDLRSDGFERSYAIRWLTVLISQAESWNTEATESSSLLNREALIQQAASLLSTCSGTSAAGVIVRDFVFTADYLAGSRTLKVHLTDIPLGNGDYSSVGAQTWGGACVLAETIVEDPERFGLLRTNMQKDFRLLELGAGTGLVSLTIGRLLEYEPLPEASRVDIIATDYHPSVLANLQFNMQSNFPIPLISEQAGNVIRISTHRLDWSLFAGTCAPPPFHEPFDLVLGADIIYEVDHASWIKSCLEKLLRKPTLSDGSFIPQFHLVIPLRATHIVESDTVEKTFTSRGLGRQDGETLELGIMSKETIICDAGSGLGTEQIEYAYYVIGWT